MIPIDGAIVERSQSQTSVSPMVVAIVWADNGAEDRLYGSYRMSGAADPASVSDLNVAMSYAGELALAVGSASALDTTTAAAGSSSAKQLWQTNVIDVWQLVWA